VRYFLERFKVEYIIDYNRDMSESRNLADDVMKAVRQNDTYIEMYNQLKEKYVANFLNIPSSF